MCGSTRDELNNGGRRRRVRRGCDGGGPRGALPRHRAERGGPREGLDLVVICVGPPIVNTGSTDMAQVERAIDQLAPAITTGTACVIRNTLPVGSAARLADRSRMVPGRLFVAPEFLLQESALEDIRRPTRVVVGTLDEHANPDALAPAGTPLLVIRAEEASLVKNASNVFLAVRLTFANEVPVLRKMWAWTSGQCSMESGTIPGSATRICDRATASAAVPIQGGPLALQRGSGPWAPMHLAEAISDANADHQRRFAQRIAQAVGRLAGKRVALLASCSRQTPTTSAPPLPSPSRPDCWTRAPTCGPTIQSPATTPGEYSRIWRSYLPRRRRSRVQTPR